MNLSQSPVSNGGMMMRQQQMQQQHQQPHDLSFQVDYGDGNGPMNPNSPQQSTTTTGSSTNTTLEFVQNQLKQSSHPTVIIFHIVFKLASLVVYLFGGWFLGGPDRGARFISITVICILLLAADFWVVKNVTGRLLVGLRWWNQVDDDGTRWIFESSEGKRPINNFDQTIFWSVLYGTPFIWTILFLIGLISFKWNWLLIVIMALTLSGANVYGYYRCSSEQKLKTQQMMQQYATQGAIAVMRTNVFSAITTAAAGIATAAASGVVPVATGTTATTNTNTARPGNFV